MQQNKTMFPADVIVIGGGVVGSAIAYGLVRQGLRVRVLDEGDLAFRASRGNFGLVWVQGKGYGCAEYARWTLASSRLWPQLQAELLEDSGVDVKLQQGAGYHLCLSEAEVKTRRERLQWLQDYVGADDYKFEFLDPGAVNGDLPPLGPEVRAVSYSQMDGHCNPLKLLNALHIANQRRGVDYRPGTAVRSISYQSGLFSVQTADEHMEAPRVVIAAGLDSQRLAAQVGVFAPIRPNKGQVLITERLAKMWHAPTNYVRQTDEGTVQIGDSMEDVGLDDSVRIELSGTVAERALRCFPSLRNARLVRTWAALRVMTPDGFPIYHQSDECSGAFVVAGHSGITLAAQHVLTVAPWIAGSTAPSALAPFVATRFSPDTPITRYGH